MNKKQLIVLSEEKYRFEDVKGYFARRVNNLEELLSANYRLEVAILALGYIDALGNLFMKGKGSKENFLNLIFSYGVVDNFRWDKVNLAEFKRIKEESKESCPVCYKAINYANDDIREYDYSESSKCIARDKTMAVVENEILSQCRDSDKSCKCKVSLSKCFLDATYGGILYRKYRCEGVHKGKLDEQWDSLASHFDQPFYMSVEDNWPDFSIPTGFILKTLKCCLSNLEKESLKHG